MKLTLDDTFTKELPADKDQTNTRRQVSEACFSFVKPIKTKAPEMLHSSAAVAKMLGITEEQLTSNDFIEVFTGNKLLEGSEPYAMCYGGHQFGHWAGQLGDGRAINLGEAESNGKRWAVQLKGAGPTPYSRTADGLAVLRSSVREYLCSEAMYYLGVPTTRALSLAITGDEVLRDVLYNGNPAYEKGAVVCRVAPSFIRFGSFEIFSQSGDVDNLRKLTDYTIKHFYPEVEEGTKKGYVEFFRQVAILTLDLVINWQRVGFVHGVMNTDNMSILGQTIDYGPYGWLEGYDKKWTPNTTDAQHKRYQYGQQSNIALWNLLKLANALYPLINEAEQLEQVLNEYKTAYAGKYLGMMKAKLGLETEDDNDLKLIQELEKNLRLTETDMTIFFRNLANVSKKDEISNLNDLDFLGPIKDAFYKPEDLKGETLWFWKGWINEYKQRLQQETKTDTDRKEAMNDVNPKYVLRNYMSQVAIDAADNKDYTVIDELFNLLKQPYAEQPEMEKWFVKRPEWARTKVGCSMLSCSS